MKGLAGLILKPETATELQKLIQSSLDLAG